MSPAPDIKRFASKLEKSFKGKIADRVGMKRLTTFRIGGLAELILYPRTLEDLETAVENARKFGVPWKMLGAGSNLLVLDGGVSEALINTCDAFLDLDIPEDAIDAGEETIVTVGAGVKLANAVKQCQIKGLTGIEWAAGIPGSLGGAVIMNAGSMGSSMSDSLEWVEWYVPGEGVERVKAEDIVFDYRWLERPPGAIVTRAGLRLTADDPKAIRETIVKGLKWRRINQPLSYPSAGSVFKNPEGDYAGRLIEECGLKGDRNGDAQISDLHANFIVNRGRAKSREVTDLIELARNKVKEKFGVDLELEIEIIGEELS